MGETKKHLGDFFRFNLALYLSLLVFSVFTLYLK